MICDTFDKMFGIWANIQSLWYSCWDQRELNTIVNFPKALNKVNENFLNVMIYWRVFSNLSRSKIFISECHFKKSKNYNFNHWLIISSLPALSLSLFLFLSLSLSLLLQVHGPSNNCESWWEENWGSFREN